MARMQIISKDLLQMLTKIDKKTGKLKEAADEALTQTQEYVQSSVTSASGAYAGRGKKGYAKGNMFRSIKGNDGVIWKGQVAEVSVGFDFKQNGGYHSIFIMYGTPRIKKDTAVYNAIRGEKTRKEIERIQKEVFEKYLSLGD